MKEFKNYLINHLFNNYSKYYDSYEEFKAHFDSGEIKISVADINKIADEYDRISKESETQAAKAAVKIAESVKPELTAQEQAFFIAGFQECLKWQSQQKETKPTGLRWVKASEKHPDKTGWYYIQKTSLKNSTAQSIKDIFHYDALKDKMNVPDYWCEVYEWLDESGETEETKPVEEYKNPLKEMEEEIKEANFTENDFPTKPVEDKADIIAGIISEYENGKDYIPKGLNYADYQTEHTELLRRIYDRNIQPTKPVSEEGWIRVEDGLPKRETDEVIVCYNNKNEGPSSICSCFHKGNFYVLAEWEKRQLKSHKINNVTHWQPLPKPPITNK